ncbi:MAG: DivIVA domain-containing protein [Acidimicrobiia bacterium]
MKISPRELREAQIPSKAFGFNQDVVDALLERAADTIEGLIEENRQLFEALERLKTEGSTAPIADPFAEVKSVEPQVQEMPVQNETIAPASNIDEELLIAQVNEKEELINKTLLLAQKTADETLKTAKSQADELVSNATQEAKEMVEKAQTQADSLTGQAKVDAEKELEDAKIEADKLVAEAQSKADGLVSAAQAQADSIHAEERNKFVALVEELTQQRAQLLSDISVLQDFDKEHRTKLRDVIEQDLSILTQREQIDVDAVPELPIVERVEIKRTPESEPKAAEPEVVATSAESAPSSFDEMLDQDVVVPAGEIEDDDTNDQIEVLEAQVQDTQSNYSDQDPFAAFVDGPVVEPAGSDTVLDAEIVEGDYEEVESSVSKSAFEPGSSKSSSNTDLDDDDFFASLRQAVQDDSPLGPSDEDDTNDGKHKGFFKK